MVALSGRAERPGPVLHREQSADPESNYASSDFDQTHVFLVNYSYTIPNATKSKLLGESVNGWIIGGQTVAESGQPYSVYDYSGSVGSLYFGTSNDIGNPLVPLKPGVTPKQAQLQGTTGVNAGKPVLNALDFEPQFVAPGTNGVPPCDPAPARAIITSLSTAARAAMFSAVLSRCASI